MIASEQELVGRIVARWLAPYIEEELAQLPARARRRGALTPEYDEATCTEFVVPLGDVVLRNGEVLFGWLASSGEITSLDLADELGVASPRQISAVLTTPLKRRAKALQLPLPWNEGERDGRTVWIGRDAIARRMLTAIQAERERRGGKERQ